MDKLLKELDTYRLSNRLTQKQLADKLRVTCITVNRWLNGRHKPNRMQKYHIEKLLKGIRK
jgi:transcriptional regulator with XRE-family HTH domain